MQVLDQLAVGARKSRGKGGAAALTGQAWYQQQALRWAALPRDHALCMPAGERCQHTNEEPDLDNDHPRPRA